MTTATPPSGLTTSEAPFVEEARDRGDLFIRQPYELYDDDNQEAWRRLYRRMLPRWRRYSNPRFQEGIDSLALASDGIPRLEDVNHFLAPLTGFEAKAVSGYVPAYLFFDCLRRREFPTTITIRDKGRLDYLPEPDIFHDIAGHVPMHTDRQFADVLVRLGEVAQGAAARAADARDEATRLQQLDNNLKAMARFFWFTIEFGLMRRPDGEACVYGSGLLSSYGEIAHAVESPTVQRYPFQLEWAINQGFEIDRYQPLLFIVESFEHLFEQVDRLESWLTSGRLDQVSPGEPSIEERDLRSFVQAGRD